MLEHLHQCKVRQLLKYRNEWGAPKLREYLSKANFDKKTIDDFIDQWKLGNRGEWGTWIESSLQQQGLGI
jgi:hypothetical protein